MNLYPIILGLVVLGGIGISIWGWRVLAASRKARQWPRVEGVIEEAELSSATNDLLPHIVFSYQVEDKQYRRAFEFPEGTHALPEFAQSYVRKYPVGARVQVYYDPGQADHATLEPGAQGDWMILVLGLLMVVGGLAALLLV